MLLPGRATEVEQLQRRARGLASFSQDSGVALDSLYDRLFLIYESVCKAERRFYEQLKLDSKNPESSLLRFQNKLDSFLSDNFIKSLSNGQIVNKLGEKYSFETATKNSLVDDKKLLNDLLALVSENVFIKQRLPSGIKAKILTQAINSFAEGIGHGNIKVSHQAGEKMSSLGGVLASSKIRITTNPDHKGKKGQAGANRVEYFGDETNFLSREVRDKIQTLVDNSFSSQQQDASIKPTILSLTKKQLIEEIAIAARQCGAKQEYIDILVQKAKTSEIFVNRSKSGIIGFLGELQIYLFMNHMNISENLGWALSATGNKRYLTGRTGQEILTDIMWNGFGFQIKNYQDTKDFEIKGTISARGFVENRLRIESDSVQELLLDFFGSYQYNQPLKHYPDSMEESLMEYLDIYDEFDKIFKQFYQLFDSHADNILGISDATSTWEMWQEKALNQTYWFNSFFIIGKRIIPSSVILNGILTQLQRGGNYITSSYTLKEPSNSSYTFESMRGIAGKEEAYTAAHLTDVSYRLKFHLNELLGLGAIN